MKSLKSYFYRAAALSALVAGLAGGTTAPGLALPLMNVFPSVAQQTRTSTVTADQKPARSRVSSAGFDAVEKDLNGTKGLALIELGDVADADFSILTQRLEEGTAKLKLGVPPPIITVDLAKAGNAPNDPRYKGLFAAENLPVIEVAFNGQIIGAAFGKEKSEHALMGVIADILEQYVDPAIASPSPEQKKLVRMVTLSSFDSEVWQSDKPVLVEVGAEWCSPCRTLKQVLPRMAEEAGNRLKIARVDIDQVEVAAQAMTPDQIKSDKLLQIIAQNENIPLLMLVRNGEVVALNVGYGGQWQLRAWVEDHLGQNIFVLPPDPKIHAAPAPAR